MARTLGVALALALLGGCGADKASLIVPEGPRVLRNTTLAVGECMTQDDCQGALVCVAVSPRQSRCEANEKVRAANRGPKGQPPPPVGLLDGRVLRRHVGLAE